MPTADRDGRSAIGLQAAVPACQPMAGSPPARFSCQKDAVNNYITLGIIVHVVHCLIPTPFACPGGGDGEEGAPISVVIGERNDILSINN